MVVLGRDLRFDTAAPGDLPSIVAALDREFVHGRGRTVSVAERFPDVYRAGNTTHLYVVRGLSGIVGCVATLKTLWQRGDAVVRLRMVGSVFVAPQARGRGIGSAMVRALGERLAEGEDQVAVLWTTRPAFYERCGWFSSDPGIFGVLPAFVSRPGDARVTRAPLGAGARAMIEELRGRHLRQRLLHPADRPSHIPFPAQRVWVFSVESGSRWSACAIVGEAEEAGYLYEVLGEPASIPAVVAAVAGAFPKVFVNERHGSPFATWLNRTGDAGWQEKRLAMWKPLSPEVTMAEVRDWYIPLLERI